MPGAHHSPVYSIDSKATSAYKFEDFRRLAKVNATL
jgi:hypothetical protein